MSEADSEQILYDEHPKMFRNRPFYFSLLLISIIGWPWLIHWWLKTLGEKLTVTNARIIHRTGILSKSENEVRIKHVRNVQIRQSPLQRVMNTGYLGISTAGQSDVEIALEGMPDPDGVQDMINARIGDQDALD